MAAGARRESPELRVTCSPLWARAALRSSQNTRARTALAAWRMPCGTRRGSSRRDGPTPRHDAMVFAYRSSQGCTTREHYPLRNGAPEYPRNRYVPTRPALGRRLATRWYAWVRFVARKWCEPQR